MLFQQQRKILVKKTLRGSFLGLILLFAFSCSGQNIKGALIVGLNATQVDGDECYGYHKFGLNVGPMAIIPINKVFSVSIETLYNQKGSYQRKQYNDSLSGEYKLKLNYLEVPVLFHYEDKGVVNFGTGFSWGRLVEFGEWEHGYKVNWGNSTGPYKRTDVDWIFDVQFRLSGNMKFDFRYAYSVAKLRTRTFLTGEARKQFNNVLSLRLVYVFKDTPAIKPQSIKDNK